MRSRSAKRYNPRMGQASAESVPVAEAARLLGVSVRTVKRMCEAGELASFRTAGAGGGHLRLPVEAIKAFRQQGHASPAPGLTSGVLQNKREGLETLNLELQERRVKRELAKLSEEDAEADRRREAAARAEELANKCALEESRERREREQRQAEVERERHEWADSWLDYALKSLPQDTPRATALDVHESVEAALAKFTPEQPQSVVQCLVLAAVDKALKPWKRRQEIERAVQEASKELPALVQGYFEPSEWEVRTMQAAREAIAKLPADASLAEVRAAAVQAGKRVAGEYQAEQAQAQADRERQRREVSKKFLVDIGVGHVAPYLAKLQADGAIWDEDLDRKLGLEAAVRKVLEDRLTGAEGFEEAQRVARVVVDHELE